MGTVSEHLRNVIAKQINEHGLVIWYDPKGHYAQAVAALDLPETTIVRYEGSFFALRHEIEPFLDQEVPPRLVVYVPLDSAESDNALAEVESTGVILKPGQQPPSRNTRLAAIARNALKPVLGEEQVTEIEKQVEAGKLTLADLDKMGGSVGGVLSIIFGTDDYRQIALRFLSDDGPDTDLQQKDALVELGTLLASAYEMALSEGEPPDPYRQRFARHVLATELMQSLQGNIPNALSSISTVNDPAACEACVALAAQWRLRRDLRESYGAHARRVGADLGLDKVKFELEQVAAIETFLETERALLFAVEKDILDHVSEERVVLAQGRRSSFWSEQLPEVQAEWALAAVAGQLLLAARQIEAEMPALSSFSALFEAYTRTVDPWCLLDTYHRHMERRCHQFDFGSDERYPVLEQLIARARSRYMDVGAKLAERFIRQYRDGKFRLSGIERQVDTFDKQVKPRLSEGRTAYVWVDALRFEMARELVDALAGSFQIALRPVVAAVPTITEIGMAALLPGAQESSRVVPAGEGKLALAIQDQPIKDRKGRVDFLKFHHYVGVAETNLRDLLPRPQKKVRQAIREADLVLVTSQEIDSLCEGDNIHLARLVMDSVLHELSRAFRVLAELGVRTIVVAADHGYLFGEELGVEMKIDPPGGDTVDLHRRVWIGHGGAASDAYLRARVSDFGLESDLELATPWNFACFKVPGGTRAYFHGGLSPQELIVPVLTLTPHQTPEAEVKGDIAWTLEKGSVKITTRFFSVTMQGQSAGLFAPTAPKVRIEIRAGGKVISQPVTASYGFEEATGDVQLRLKKDDPKGIDPCAVTLKVKEELSEGSATIHLLDVTTETELARLEDVQIAISI